MSKHRTKVPSSKYLQVSTAVSELCIQWSIYWFISINKSINEWTDNLHWLLVGMGWHSRIPWASLLSADQCTERETCPRPSSQEGRSSVNFHLEGPARGIALWWNRKVAPWHLAHTIEGDMQGPGYVGSCELYKVFEYFSTWKKKALEV